MGIFRLGHVEVRVPDLELCAAYYTEVLGLVEVERQGKHVYLKGWDEHDHHSVILTDDRPLTEYFLSLSRDKNPDLSSLKGDVKRYIVGE